MGYVTECPKGHQLFIVKATVYPKGVEVSDNGFILDSFDSEDERVGCLEEGCMYEGDLETDD